MTRILLMRHGDVEGISRERFRGRADLPLTAEGGASPRRRRAAFTTVGGRRRSMPVRCPDPRKPELQSAGPWARRKSIEDALAQWQFESYRANLHPADIETGLVFELESAQSEK